MGVEWMVQIGDEDFDFPLGIFRDRAVLVDVDPERHGECRPHGLPQK